MAKSEEIKLLIDSVNQEINELYKIYGRNSNAFYNDPDVDAINSFEYIMYSDPYSETKVDWDTIHKFFNEKLQPLFEKINGLNDDLKIAKYHEEQDEHLRNIKQ